MITSPAPKSTQIAHKARMSQFIVEFIATHGPMPRAQALPLMAREYRDTLSKKNVLDKLQVDLVFHMREMVAAGELIRGERPQQILSLP